jgi:hypothetical protein
VYREVIAIIEISKEDSFLFIIFSKIRLPCLERGALRNQKALHRL